VEVQHDLDTQKRNGFSAVRARSWARSMSMAQFVQASLAATRVSRLSSYISPSAAALISTLSPCKTMSVPALG
jgi:hypothetical protein